MTQSRYIPLSHWPKYHPWPSVPGLRHIFFHREYNGSEAVFSRVGRRILINEAKFFEWIESRNGLSALDPDYIKFGKKDAL